MMLAGCIRANASGIGQGRRLRGSGFGARAGRRSRWRRAQVPAVPGEADHGARLDGRKSWRAGCERAIQLLHFGGDRQLGFDSLARYRGGGRQIWPSELRSRHSGCWSTLGVRWAALDTPPACAPRSPWRPAAWRRLGGQRKRDRRACAQCQAGRLPPELGTSEVARAHGGVLEGVNAQAGEDDVVTSSACAVRSLSLRAIQCLRHNQAGKSRHERVRGHRALAGHLS